MTIATTPAPGALPAAGTGDHLTADDTARIAAALDAAYAETTRKVYAFAWSQWARWCHDRGITKLPAEPTAVCAYLTDRAHRAASLATINAACSAIGHQHRRHDCPTRSTTTRSDRYVADCAASSDPRRADPPGR